MSDPIVDYNTLTKEELIAKLKDKDSAYAELSRMFEQLALEASKLEMQLRKQQRDRFGKKTEKTKEFITDIEEIEQDAGEKDGDPVKDMKTAGAATPVLVNGQTAKPKRCYQTPHVGRNKFAENLERRYVYLEPEGEPDSHGVLVEEVVSEQLVVELKSYVLVKVRRKYVKKGIFSIAKISLNDIFFKHRLSLDTVAFILMMRYALHTPYNRILSLIPEPTLTYNTLVETACRGANALLPLAPVLLEEVKKCKDPITALGVDESPFDVLDTPANIEAFKLLVGNNEQEDDANKQTPSQLAKQEQEEQDDVKGPKKIIHTGRVWILINPEAGLSYCHYTATRQKAHPEAFLKDYNGPLVSDAYAAYLSIAKNPEYSITLMLCWAHARRHFVDLIRGNKKPDPVAKEVVRMIRQLYRIETKLKDKTPDQILEARKESRALLLEKIKPYLEEQIKLYTPKESMHDAIDYILRNWEYFIKYTELPGGKIDNNFSERNLRPTTLTRKNSLFFGSVKCAAGSALMLSLVQCCKLNGVNVLEWITDVLGRITTYPKDKLAELLPHKWKPPNQQFT